MGSRGHSRQPSRQIPLAANSPKASGLPESASTTHRRNPSRSVADAPAMIGGAVTPSNAAGAAGDSHAGHQRAPSRAQQIISSILHHRTPSRAQAGPAGQSLLTTTQADSDHAAGGEFADVDLSPSAEPASPNEL